MIEDELRGYGLDDDEIGTIVKLLKRLLASARSQKKGRIGEQNGAATLVKWVYSSGNEADGDGADESEATLCVNITAAEFLEMKQQTDEGTARLLAAQNAGGTSHLSEAYSFELVSRLLGGRILLDKTEMEIEYKDKSSITDYTFLTLTDERIAISVTRACGQEFDDAAAEKLLLKKLHGVNQSTRNVEDADAWSKQILHVWCESQSLAELVAVCFRQKMTPQAKRDTFLLLSIADAKELFYSSEESAAIMRYGAIKLGSVKSIFCKEIAARPSYDPEPALTSSALACRNHSFYGDPLGGLKCQVCSFETTNRVWKCRHCDIFLCGSCMDKWKSKINK